MRTIPRNIIGVAVGIGVILLVTGLFGDRINLDGISDPGVSGRLSEIKRKGEIVIGTDATYPPLESIDANGTFVGMDIEIAREIAQDLGVQATFKNIGWDRIFDDLRAGKVDMVISSITITKERTETLGFSDPYFNAGQVIVSTTSAAAFVRGPQDLSRLRVGVQPDTTSAREAGKYTSNPNLVIVYNDYNVAKDDILAGKLDALVIDYPAGASLARKNQGLRIVGGIFTQEFYGIATQKNDQDLLLQINKTIRRLKQEGTLKKLEQRWLGN